MKRLELTAYFVMLLTLIVAASWTGCGGDEEEPPQVIVLRATIEGKVLDQTTLRGIASAEVRLSNGMVTQTAPDGSFVFDDIPSDTYTVTVVAQGYLGTETNVKLTRDGATANIRLQPGVRVFGVVRSDDGFPVANVRITLGERATVTNGQGQYEISPIGRGQYNLMAEKPGYTTVQLGSVVVGDTDIERDIGIERSLKGRLLFVRADVIDKTYFGISVVNADGTNLIPLTNFFDENPTWSPDGNQIIFTRTEGNIPRQVYTMRDNGGIPNNLSSVYHNDRNATWSPDGRQIAFVHAEILEPAAIYIMDVNGNDRVRLAECDKEAKPTWSPDSNRIAFERRSDLFVLTIDAFIAGQNQPPPEPPDPENPEPQQPENPVELGVEQLTRNAEKDVHPDWSPNGASIAFTVQEDQWNADVYILDLFTLVQSRLTEGVSYNGYPCWSPDGTKVAFSSNRDGSFGIWVIDADGSNMTRVHDKLGEDELLSQGGWQE